MAKTWKITANKQEVWYTCCSYTDQFFALFNNSPIVNTIFITLDMIVLLSL